MLLFPERRLLESQEQQRAEERGYQSGKEHAAPPPPLKWRPGNQPRREKKEKRGKQPADPRPPPADQARNRASPVRRHGFGPQRVRGSNDTADKHALHQAKKHKQDWRYDTSL